MYSAASKENIILEIYKKNIDLRIFLLDIDFNALEDDSFFNRTSINYSNRSTEDLQVFIQLSIISKIMMMIEDFAVLSISYIQGRNFYDLLLTENTEKCRNCGKSTLDLGKSIGEFILEELPKLNHNQILKIMNWIDLDKIKHNSNDNDLDLKVNYLTQNEAIIQSKFEEIASFSDDFHHSAFKRFKHGGIPIFPAYKHNYKQYEYFSLISTGENFQSDLSLIPYHFSVFEKYKEFVQHLKATILEIIENKQRCNNHNLPGVYPKLNPRIFKDQRIAEIIKQYDLSYPLDLSSINTDIYDRKTIQKLISRLPKFYNF